ncbi:hypothetical protein [Aquirhabdus sp.]|uniref:hypothetical protein n=1 Tax=Aquirhabdus sp. TaxID=2824160 RepID=UPI00396C7583
MNEFIRLSLTKAEKLDQDLSLINIFELIPENNLFWSVLEFDGIGEAPFDWRMDEFTRLVLRTDGGIQLDWFELKKFILSVQETYHCLIVGAKSTELFSKDRRYKENFLDSEYVIEVFDGGELSFFSKYSQVNDVIESTFYHCII